MLSKISVGPCPCSKLLQHQNSLIPCLHRLDWGYCPNVIKAHILKIFYFMYMSSCLNACLYITYNIMPMDNTGGSCVPRNWTYSHFHVSTRNWSQALCKSSQCSDHLAAAPNSQTPLIIYHLCNTHWNLRLVSWFVMLTFIATLSGLRIT